MDRGVPADRFALTGHVLDGRFRVASLVGEGGYGCVYRASHVTLERPVALKVLKLPDVLAPAAVAAAHAAFVQEAKTVARLMHPSVVQVLDFGVSTMPNGVLAPWAALEWLDGPTLRDELAARQGRGGRSPAECLALLRPVLEALAYAHAQGVAHRDLKPANVMRTQARPDAPLKLLDFGVAKVMEGDERSAGTGATRTRGAVAPYSLPYAAPEQVGGARTGPWTDVHAAALLCTEVLTDAPAYRVEGGATLFAAVLAPRRPTPGAYGYDVGAWESVLARALALRPAERFAHAGELLTALERALPTARHHWTGHPGAPAPASVEELATSQSNRAAHGSGAPTGAGGARGRRTVALGLGLAGLGLAALGGLAVWKRARESRAVAAEPTMTATETPRSIPTTALVVPTTGSTSASPAEAPADREAAAAATPAVPVATAPPLAPHATTVQHRASPAGRRASLAGGTTAARRGRIEIE